MIRLQYMRENSRKWHDSSLTKHDAGVDNMREQALVLMELEGWGAARCVDDSDRNRVYWRVADGCTQYRYVTGWKDGISVKFVTPAPMGEAVRLEGVDEYIFQWAADPEIALLQHDAKYAAHVRRVNRGLLPLDTY